LDDTEKNLVKLTPTEAEIAEWAIGPLNEYGEELEAESPGEGWKWEEVPTLDKHLLDLNPAAPAAVEDLLSRLVHHYPDMVDEGENDYWPLDYADKGMDWDRACRAAKSKARRHYAAAESLIEKIKEACNEA
jgi:hypothetical protein